MVEAISVYARLKSKPAVILAALITSCPGLCLTALAADYCDRLKAELSAPSHGSSVAAPAQAWRKLTNAEARAAHSGCFGGFLNRRSKAQCSRLLARIGKLQQKLAARNSVAPEFGSRGAEWRRTSIKQAYAKAGCGNGPNEDRLARTAGRPGEYRTLCVRSCDGYYFPLSWGVPQQDFPRDQAVCQSMYSSGEAELYFHRVPTEGSDAMVSITGKRYADQPFAFSFRQTYSPQCAAPGAGLGDASIFGVEGLLSASTGDMGPLRPQISCRHAGSLGWFLHCTSSSGRRAGPRAFGLVANIDLSGRSRVYQGRRVATS